MHTYIKVALTNVKIVLKNCIRNLLVISDNFLLHDIQKGRSQNCLKG